MNIIFFFYQLIKKIYRSISIEEIENREKILSNNIFSEMNGKFENMKGEIVKIIQDLNNKQINQNLREMLMIMLKKFLY